MHSYMQAPVLETGSAKYTTSLYAPETSVIVFPSMEMAGTRIFGLTRR